MQKAKKLLRQINSERFTISKKRNLFFFKLRWYLFRKVRFLRFSLKDIKSAPWPFIISARDHYDKGIGRDQLLYRRSFSLNADRMSQGCVIKQLLTSV